MSFERASVIYLNFPVSSWHGWGICGQYLALELSKITEVRLITESFVEDDLEQRSRLLRLIAGPEEVDLVDPFGAELRVPGPLLVPTGNFAELPARLRLKGRRTFAYSVFEENVIAKQEIELAQELFDGFVVASTWCENVLDGHGLKPIFKAIQGFDPGRFRQMSEAEGNHMSRSDDFVLFSGGKFEFRKGQDIVIRAYKVLQDRHKDVRLIAAWWNSWPHSLSSMAMSKLIAFDQSLIDKPDVIERTLLMNGIDLARVTVIGGVNNQVMARVYHSSDLGIFPNRCEGATNLVLMEYMASGKPVLATNTTGHGDVVMPENALVPVIKTHINLLRGGRLIATWPEADLDDVVSRLEWAYQNRSQLAGLGKRAGVSIANRTWAHTASQIACGIGSR